MQFCCNFCYYCNMNLDTYIKTLKSNSLSDTKPRRAVFSALSSVQKPLSMNELISVCKNTDRVSVYRTIETFEKFGIVNRIHIGWKYKIELSDNFKEHHHHLTCFVCGSMIDFDEPEGLDEELYKIANSANFKLQKHVLELRGICSSCQK